MCGFLFYHSKSKRNNISSQDFETALMTMKYRGPDATGIVKNETSYLGHVRLSIIDDNVSSNQPTVASGLQMLYNGEIYNYKDLDPLSKSDTLTLFNGFQSYGNSFLHNLKGMYSILFLSEHQKKLTLIRDFFGEKPLYLFENDDHLVISSTIKSLRFLLKVVNISLNINQNAINDLLFFGFIREPETIYSQIECIVPGFIHTLSLDNYTWEKKRLMDKVEIFKRDSAEKYLGQSVTATDFTPLLLLSSGIDSTYVAAHIVKNSLSAHFTSYRNKNAKTDETVLAAINLNKMNYDRELTTLQHEVSSIELYSTLAASLEQPATDGLQLINIFTAIKSKQPEVKVVLTGLGGDEMYGGYNSFIHYKKYLALSKMGLFARTIAPTHFKRFFDPIIPERGIYSYYYRYRIDPMALKIFSVDKIEKNYFRFKDSLCQLSSGSKNSLHMLKYCEAMDYMRNQLLRVGDNIAMCFGLENRSPLLFYPAVYSSDNGRNNQKNYLKQQYNIMFPLKQGFTLAEDIDGTLRYYITQCRKLNNELDLFDRDLIDQISIQDISYRKMLKAVYITLLWGKSNLK